MTKDDLKYMILNIHDYDVYSKVEEAFPEKWCLIQAMIYGGDYGLRCGMCKFNCRWGQKLGQCGCNRPWTCN